MHPFLTTTVFEYALVEFIVLTPLPDEPPELIKVITHYVGRLSLKMLRIVRPTNGGIQFLTSIAGCDYDRPTPLTPQTIQYIGYKVVNALYGITGRGVVDPQPACRIGMDKLIKCKILPVIFHHYVSLSPYHLYVMRHPHPYR